MKEQQCEHICSQCEIISLELFRPTLVLVRLAFDSVAWNLEYVELLPYYRFQIAFAFLRTVVDVLLVSHPGSKRGNRSHIDRRDVVDLAELEVGDMRGTV